MTRLLWMLAVMLQIANVAIVAHYARGPAHVHVGPIAHPGPHPGHSHPGVEHHRHGANEGAIEVDDQPSIARAADALAQDAGKRAPAGSPDTIDPARNIDGGSSAGTIVVKSAFAGRPPPFPGRIDRPPKLSAPRLFFPSLA